MHELCKPRKEQIVICKNYQSAAQTSNQMSVVSTLKDKKLKLDIYQIDPAEKGRKQEVKSVRPRSGNPAGQI